MAACLSFGAVIATGVGGTVLIGLVVITFDAQTTREWLLVAALSVGSSWALDPLKTMCVTLALTSLTCKERRHRTLREAAQEMQLARLATRKGTACASTGYTIEVRCDEVGREDRSKLAAALATEREQRRQQLHASIETEDRFWDQTMVASEEARARASMLSTVAALGQSGGADGAGEAVACTVEDIQRELREQQAKVAAQTKGSKAALQARLEGRRAEAGASPAEKSACIRSAVACDTPMDTPPPPPLYLPGCPDDTPPPPGGDGEAELGRQHAAAVQIGVTSGPSDLLHLGGKIHRVDPTFAS